MLTQRAHKLPDVTPTRLARAIDPFSPSAKDAWRPPTYEKKVGRATSDCDASPSHAYASRPVHSPTPKQRVPATDADVPDLCLTDDEYEKPKPPRRFATQGEMDQEKWDRVVSNAIDRQNGVIDLGYVFKYRRSLLSNFEHQGHVLSCSADGKRTRQDTT